MVTLVVAIPNTIPRKRAPIENGLSRNRSTAGRRGCRILGDGASTASRGIRDGFKRLHWPRWFVCISRRRTSFIYVWYFLPRPRNQWRTSSSTRRLTNRSEEHTSELQSPMYLV